MGSISSNVEFNIIEESKIIVREDKCAFSESKDKLVTRFYDGTVITKDKGNNRVVIEHPYYLKV
jgi:phage baseplate assembly protein gpV